LAMAAEPCTDWAGNIGPKGKNAKQP